MKKKVGIDMIFFRNSASVIRNIVSIGIAMSLWGAAISAQTPDNDYVPNNAPNEISLKCLQDPSAECALQAAIQTVIDEELSGEKARILIAVAEALVQRGDIERAKKTLNLALSAARDSGLSIIYQEKLQWIAPLFVRAGDSAGGLAIAGDARIGVVKNRVLANIALEAAHIGDIDALRIAISQLSNKTRAFWEELNLLTRMPKASLKSVSVDYYIDLVKKLPRADYEYRGLVLVAILAFKLDQKAVADQLIDDAEEVFQRIVNDGIKMDLAGLRVQSMYAANMPKDFQEASYAKALKIQDANISGLTRMKFAKRLAAYEVSSGKIDRALARLDAFDTPEEKAIFFEKLTAQKALENQAQITNLEAHYAEMLIEVQSIETPYERDSARLSLLRGAIGNKLTKSALAITATMEDDDTLALSLALVSPIL